MQFWGEQNTKLVNMAISALMDTIYSPPTLSESLSGYHVLIFGGATQTGKSARADSLIAKAERDFAYGPKVKIRPNGVKKEGDDERPDSLIISPQELARLEKQGHVLRGAEYIHDGTRYIPLLSHPDKGFSAVPENNHVVYVSLTHDGAMKIKEALRQYTPLTFLLYTKLDTLRKRLNDTNMSDIEIARRIQNYEADFAQFKFKTDCYIFLFHVKSPSIQDHLYRDQSARERARAEVQRDANSIVDLIARFQGVFKPSMGYLEVHQAFVESRLNALLGMSLDNLRRRQSSGAEVKLDLGEQTQRYISAGNYLSEAELLYLSNIKPLLVTANGRHTLLIRGFGDPYQHTNNGHKPVEDILIDFVVEKLGEQPTLRELVIDQIPDYKSHLGLVKVLDDTLLKSASTYSLANTHLVDNTHPSLSIVFAYSRRDDVDLRRTVVGMDSLEVRSLEDRIIH